MNIKTIKEVPQNSEAHCPFGHGVVESLPSEMRARTRDHHHRAEFHPLQQSIVRGEIDRGTYATFTAAMWRVHRRLEEALDEAATLDPRVAGVVADHHRRLHHFDHDLTLLGGSADLPDSVAIAAQVDRWLLGATGPQPGSTPPIAWIGVLYVLEGSSNGGQVIAKVLRRAWSLDEDALRSLDPHAGGTASRWGEFRARLEAQTFEPHDREVVVAAAAATFEGISSIMDAVASHHGFTANI